MPGPLKDAASGGRWTNEEHDRFLQGMSQFGRRWTKIAEVVGEWGGPASTHFLPRCHPAKFTYAYLVSHIFGRNPDHDPSAFPRAEMGDQGGKGVR